MIGLLPWRLERVPGYDVQLTLTRAPGPITVGEIPAGVMIRPIQETDLDEVGRLYAVSDPDAAAGTLDEALHDVRTAWNGAYGRLSGPSSLVAANDSGRLVGAILVVHDPPWPDVSDDVFIIDLFVHPTRQRSGIGRALLGTALAFHTESRVGLRVESTNAPAVRLYRSYGFVDRE